MTMADEVLRKLREKAQAGNFSDAEIASLVTDAIEVMAQENTPEDVHMRKELADLADYIRKARRELGALKATSSIGDHIPSATDELDAVVGATEEATNEIMNCCDEIGNIAGRVGGADGEALQNVVTRIFEACNFQDITGQRITKVVKTLKYIETHINELVDTFGVSSDHEEAVAKSEDEKLLNGPQLPGNASTQDEIDKLLAGK